MIITTATTIPITTTTMNTIITTEGTDTRTRLLNEVRKDTQKLQDPKKKKSK
jgi:hypothetical protein